jgi:hypothetical protein
MALDSREETELYKPIRDGRIPAIKVGAITLNH